MKTYRCDPTVTHTRGVCQLAVSDGRPHSGATGMRNAEATSAGNDIARSPGRGRQPAAAGGRSQRRRAAAGFKGPIHAQGAGGPLAKIDGNHRMNALATLRRAACVLLLASASGMALAG